MLFGGFGYQRKSFLNSGNNGFGLSRFGSMLKDTGKKLVNRFISDKIDKGVNTLAQTTGVGDLIGKDNVQKGVNMLKSAVGNIF